MDIENETLKVLKENTSGLTILELAESLKIHRHTLTKYIYKLEGEERIKVRR
jgi:DNA-binding Lrp family transcriptional regulator